MQSQGQYTSHLVTTVAAYFVQDENEEMGRDLSEGRVHNLERQLALAKGYAEDMQAAFQECEDHATALDEEAEKIQEEVSCPQSPCRG